MRQKHSDIPGRKPHLVSGQFAHNAADRRLFVRVEGRLVEVPLDRIAEGVAETTGPLGAPLVRLEEGGFAWDPTQSPASVSPDGAVNVDRPPASLGAPGFLPRDISTDEIDLPAETILLEDFHVASDRIMVESLAFHLVSGSGPVRVGVLTKSGVIVSDRLVEAPTRGAIALARSSRRSTRSARVPSLAWKVTPSSFFSQASKPTFWSSSQKKRASFRRALSTRLLPAAKALPPSVASTLATTTKFGARPSRAGSRTAKYFWCTFIDRRTTSGWSACTS